MPVAGFEGKVILITGGAGFLGSALTRALARTSCRIILLAHETDPEPAPPDALAEISVIRGDIRDSEVWSSALRGVDHVFHLASQTSAYLANQDPLMDFETNVLPVMRLVENCERQSRPPDIVFAGTVTQVGVPAGVPVDERFQDHPVTV